MAVEAFEGTVPKLLLILCTQMNMYIIKNTGYVLVVVVSSTLLAHHESGSTTYVTSSADAREERFMRESTTRSARPRHLPCCRCSVGILEEGHNIRCWNETFVTPLSFVGGSHNHL